MATQERGPVPWERARDESAPAHEAFLCYRDLGPRRTFRVAAAEVGKHESLIRRWAKRHRWRDRVWAWDLHQARQDEKVVRQHREARLRERLEDLDRMGQACLYFFRKLMRRDPETGEVSFDPRFTPRSRCGFSSSP